MVSLVNDKLNRQRGIQKLIGLFWYKTYIGARLVNCATMDRFLQLVPTGSVWNKQFPLNETTIEGFQIFPFCLVIGSF